MTRGLFGLALMAWLWPGCSQPDDCIDGDQITPKRYDDCNTRCARGDRTACDRRTLLEAGLSQRCHRDHNVEACRALCHGRTHDQTACAAMR